MQSKIKNFLMIFIISAFPFLSFINKNVDQLYYFDFVYLFIYFLSFTIVISFFIFFTKKYFNEDSQAQFYFGYLILFFFSYDTIFQIIKSSEFLIFTNDRITSFFVWFFFFIFSIIFFKKFLNRTFFKFFSFYFFILLNSFLLFSAINNFNQIDRSDFDLTFSEKESLYKLLNNKLNITPNVYYIVLDHYPRNDIFNKVYNFDNTPFHEELKELGYQIANNSISNVIGTDTNMSVVFDMSLDMGKKLLQNDLYNLGYWQKGKTKVHEIFKKIGYKNIVSIDNTLQGAPCNKFNLSKTNFDRCIVKKVQISELEVNFLKATPIIDFFGKFFPSLFSYRFLYLDFINKHLEDVVSSYDNFFFYVHLLIPHPPPKYNPRCKKKIDNYEMNIVDSYFSEEAKKALLEDVKCLNKDMLIFAKKINLIDPNSIVIIQSDNGTPDQPFPLSFYNVNFWKLPEICKNKFKNDISNVNTFRIVFNCIGATDYELLKNEFIDIKIK